MMSGMSSIPEMSESSSLDDEPSSAVDCKQMTSLQEMARIWAYSDFFWLFDFIDIIMFLKNVSVTANSPYFMWRNWKINVTEGSASRLRI